MANELKNPTNHKQRERPMPAKKEQRQRDHNQGDANAVRQLIQRMLVLGFVVFDERLGHLIQPLSELPAVAVGHKLGAWIVQLLFFSPDINKNVHRSAANHSLFACFVGC
jgi:hypothetical protein